MLKEYCISPLRINTYTAGRSDSFSATHRKTYKQCHIFGGAMVII